MHINRHNEFSTENSQQPYFEKSISNLQSQNVAVIPPKTSAAAFPQSVTFPTSPSAQTPSAQTPSAPASVQNADSFWNIPQKTSDFLVAVAMLSMPSLAIGLLLILQSKD